MFAGKPTDSRMEVAGFYNGATNYDHLYVHAHGQVCKRD